MTNTPLLEISVESLASAIAAERGGANRIELCAYLAVGGVTPSEQLMRDTRAAVKLPIFAMIRPRDESFVYSASELAQMRSEIALAKSCGMDGIVLGILHRDNTINVEQARKLVELARPLPVTFHPLWNPSFRLVPLASSLPVASPMPSKALPSLPTLSASPTVGSRFFPAAASTPRISAKSYPSVAPPSSIPASAPRSPTANPPRRPSNPRSANSPGSFPLCRGGFTPPGFAFDFVFCS